MVGSVHDGETVGEWAGDSHFRARHHTVTLAAADGAPTRGDHVMVGCHR